MKANEYVGVRYTSDNQEVRIYLSDDGYLTRRYKLKSGWSVAWDADEDTEARKVLASMKRLLEHERAKPLWKIMRDDR